MKDKKKNPTYNEVTIVDTNNCDVPKEECFAKGINEKLLRLSVGLENVNDLIADLKQALA